MSRRVHVAAAVIRRGGQIFVARRPAHLHMGGLWEFPGGKVEPGESVQDALARELTEELGIQVHTSSPLIQVPYDYPDKSVLLDVWEVNDFGGEPAGLEGQETRWVTPSALGSLEFPAANKPIVDAACLPPVCAISRPAESLQAWLADLQAGVMRGVRLFVLRPPLGFSAEPEQLLKAVGSLTHAREVQWQWHRDLFANAGAMPALLAGASNYGVHLPSTALSGPCEALPEGVGLISASCHSLAEMQAAKAVHARFLLLSPVAETKQYASHQLLGWSAFADWVAGCQLPVYGLGGLSLGDVAQARAHGGQGIALQRGW